MGGLQQRLVADGGGVAHLAAVATALHDAALAEGLTVEAALRAAIRSCAAGDERSNGASAFGLQHGHDALPDADPRPAEKVGVRLP
jgi:hypothetical protein